MTNIQDETSPQEIKKRAMCLTSPFLFWGELFYYVQALTLRSI